MALISRMISPIPLSSDWKRQTPAIGYDKATAIAKAAAAKGVTIRELAKSEAGLSDAELDVLARVMKDGAELRIATDHEGFCRWALSRLRGNDSFVWLAHRAVDWRTRPEDWPETRYERKARAEGRFKDEILPVEIPQRKGEPMRLEYDGASSDTEWIKGLSGSASTYFGNYQENTTTDTDVYLWDIEAKYRWRDGFMKNFELIGDYAQWHFASPDAIADANVGNRMFGYRLELAYHHILEGDQELIPFFRLEGYDTSEGSKDSNTFTGATGRSHYLPYGLYFQLNRYMELKAAVRQSMDDADNTEFSIGVGYQF